MPPLKPWRLLWLGAVLASAASLHAAAAETVSIAVGGSLLDAPFYVAQEAGYFADEALEPKFLVFESVANEIGPLAQDALDVGSGGASAGLFNALARGVGIRIVADQGHTAPETAYQSLVIRADLIDSGAFRSLADLAGKRLGFAAAGAPTLSVANEAARAGGIAFDEIARVFLALPQQAAAFQSKGLDGGIVAEPQATVMAAAGIALRFANTDAFYPHDQIQVLLYGEKFAIEREDTAERVMRAYLRGVRRYDEALAGGRLAGPEAGPVIAILARSFHVDAELLRAVDAPAIDPDGALARASLGKDLAFFRSRGLVRGAVDLDAAIDASFAQRANAALGPDRAKARE